jgi:tetratricopeptide (TPR) repeat protein
MREALRRRPDYDLWRLDLWRILDKLGTTQLERGEADSAQEAFSAALSTIEVLTSRDSSNNNLAKARVTALARLSALPILLGRWNDARTMLERAQTAAEGILARSGPQGDGQDELAMVRMELSRVMRRLNRGQEAQSLFAAG